MKLAAVLLAIKARQGLDASLFRNDDPLQSACEIVQANPHSAEGRTIARLIAAIGKATSEEFTEFDVWALSTQGAVLVAAIADDSMVGRYLDTDLKAALIGFELARQLAVLE